MTEAEMLTEGIVGRRAGMRLADNPHEPRSDARVLWAEGWHMAPDLRDPLDPRQAELCHACACACWESGGCPMLQASGMSAALRAFINSDAERPDASAIKAAQGRLAEAVAAASLRDLVQNRRDFLAGLDAYWWPA
jgi:hypothetical protein